MMKAMAILLASTTVLVACSKQDEQQLTEYFQRVNEGYRQAHEEQRKRDEQQQLIDDAVDKRMRAVDKRMRAQETTQPMGCNLCNGYDEVCVTNRYGTVGRCIKRPW